MHYKILDGNKATNGGRYEYSLPTQSADGAWTPGEWTEPITDLVACESGYHLAKDEQLIQWLGPDIYEAEATGQMIDAGDKIVCESVRLTRKLTGWNDQTARLLSVWCAREALKLIDNPDPRSIAACDVAEKFANGEATEEELAAARDAAWAAAWAAAWDAAWAAAWDAQYKKLIEMIDAR